MPKRTIVVKDFVFDLRSGKSDLELMERYQLDARGLENALKKMVEVQALQPDEVSGHLRTITERLDPPDRRNARRNYVFFSFPIYDAKNLEVEGFVNDISELGLQIVGIQAAVGESKGLLIRADEFADIYPFVFDARCKWVNPQDPYGDYVSGFEIISISRRGREELRNLIQMLSLDIR